MSVFFCCFRLQKCTPKPPVGLAISDGAAKADHADLGAGAEALLGISGEGGVAASGVLVPVHAVRMITHKVKAV